MPKDFRLNRRQFLRSTVFSGFTLGVGLGAFETARRGFDLLDLHETWAEASQPNDIFLARHASLLNGLEMGGSFAPEQWSGRNNNRTEQALQGLDIAIDELDLRRIRLGIRWNRGINNNGRVDLSFYAPYIQRCLERDVEVCLNVGPIRTFRWPEDHVPNDVLSAISPRPAARRDIELHEPLAQRALSYLDELLLALRREYGPAFATIQPENEPYYKLGTHEWTMTLPYMRAIVQRIDAVFPGSSVLVTSAGRLNLHSVRDLFLDLLSRPDRRFEGRLVSGFDYHYRTPQRDSVPIARYFDQIAYARPFAPSLESHRRDARAAGFSIEVTEGQAEPYAQFRQPGNSARDFRFLVLRTLDRVFDRDRPKLLRIWGVEGLTRKMVAGQVTEEHEQIIELIRIVNAAARSDSDSRS